MDERNPLKMKVTELKVELGKRGLSQTGLKFDLAQRLQTAMDDDEFGAISSSLPCLSNTPASFLSAASAAKAENQATSPDVCRALGNLTPTVLEKSDIPQQISSGQEMELGTGEGVNVEPAEDDTKQESKGDNLQAQNLKACYREGNTALARQANIEENEGQFVVKERDDRDFVETLEAVKKWIVVKQTPPFNPYDPGITPINNAVSGCGVETKRLVEDGLKTSHDLNETLITLDETLFQSIAGTCHQDDAEDEGDEGERAEDEESSVDAALGERSVETVERKCRVEFHPEVWVLLPDTTGSKSCLKEKQPRQGNISVKPTSPGADYGGDNDKRVIESDGDGDGNSGGRDQANGKMKQVPKCFPAADSQESKKMTAEDLCRTKLMKRKVRFSTPSTSTSVVEMTAKLANRTKRFGVPAGAPSIPTARPNINTEARDPRGSLFTASVSSREVSAPVPRRPVARDFSSDPLPKRAKRSRVIASSSGLGGALVNRKKLQKDQSTGNIGIKRNKEEMSKNFEKLGLQPYEYEVFQRKFGGVSEPSATVKTVGHHPEHWKNIARGCSTKEAERKTAEQTAKMIERQKRFSSQGDWVRPKPQGSV